MGSHRNSLPVDHFSTIYPERSKTPSAVSALGPLWRVHYVLSLDCSLSAEYACVKEAAGHARKRRIITRSGRRKSPALAWQGHFGVPAVPGTAYAPPWEVTP